MVQADSKGLAKPNKIGKQIAGVNESQLSGTDAPADSQPEFDWEIYGR